MWWGSGGIKKRWNTREFGWHARYFTVQTLEGELLVEDSGKRSVTSVPPKCSSKGILYVG